MEEICFRQFFTPFLLSRPAILYGKMRNLSLLATFVDAVCVCVCRKECPIYQSASPLYIAIGGFSDLVGIQVML